MQLLHDIYDNFVKNLLKGPANCHRARINKSAPMLQELSVWTTPLPNHVKSAPYLSYFFLPFFAKIDWTYQHHSWQIVVHPMFCQLASLFFSVLPAATKIWHIFLSDALHWYWKKKLYGPFQLSQGCWATMKGQFTF